MIISAFALCRNTPDLSAKLLAQLPTINVVDNGSDPALPDAWLRISPNLYFSGGWNAVMKVAAAQGVEWAWLCNSDIAGISAVMLDRLVDAAKGLGAIMVSPAIIDHPYKCMRVDDMRQRVIPYIDCVAPVVNVEWFIRAGGFDEQLPGFGADVDLCFRTRKDLKLVVADQVISHLRCETSNRCGDFSMYDHEAARKHMIGKHGPAIKYFMPEAFGYHIPKGLRDENAAM